MPRILLLFLSFILITLSACDRKTETIEQKSTVAPVPKISNEQKKEAFHVEPSPRPALSKEDARRLLEELKIAYNPEDFIDRARESDAVAVDLFLAAGMSPNKNVDGVSPLSAAAMTGHSTIVKMLIERGVDPRKESHGGYDALYWAAYNEDIDTLRILLEAGVNVNPRSDHSLLTEPAKWGNIKVVKLLLENGAKPSDEAMVEATRGGQLRVMRLMLEYGADPNARDNYGTALSNAIMGGNSEMMQDLLDAGANVNARDKNGETPLMRAAYGWTDYLGLLLSHGADPNMRDNDGATALVRAVEFCGNAPSRGDVSRGVEIVTELLAAGADPSMRDREGKTAAMHADEKGCQEIVELLERPRIDKIEMQRQPVVSRKVQPKASEDRGDAEKPQAAQLTYDFAAALEPRRKLARSGIPFNMRTFVNYAERRDFDHVRLFLDAGMDPDAGDHEVGTALMHAAENGDIKMVRLLLERGANPDARFTGWDDTALHRASAKGYTEIVSALLDKGADVDVKQIHGETPLMAALAAGHTDCANLILAHNPEVNLKMDGRWGTCDTALIYAAMGGYTEIIDQLIERGADVNAEGGSGTPLAFAAAKDRLDLVKTFVDRGARVNGTSRVVPLLEAAKEGHREIVRFLLDRGADPNKRDEDGRTVFMRAVKNGYLDSLPLFIEKGADVNAKDSDGETALMYAALDGNAMAVKILLENGADAEAVDNAGANALSRAEFRGYRGIAELLEQAGAVSQKTEEPEDIQERLLSQATRLDIMVETYSKDWKPNPKGDGFISERPEGAVISIFLRGAGDKSVDFEGIELPVQIDIYAAAKQRADSNDCWQRLIYRKEHIFRSRKDKVKIPYDDIEPLRPDEEYSAVDAIVTLPGGRTIEQKTCWGSMLQPRSSWRATLDTLSSDY